MDQEVKNPLENKDPISHEKVNLKEGDEGEDKDNVNNQKESHTDSDTQPAELEVSAITCEEKQEQFEHRKEKVREEKVTIPFSFESKEPESKSLLLEIKTIIERKVAYDETKEKMFNALYEQLKGYQGEFLDALQKPLIRNLLTLYDDMIKFEEVIDQESCSEKVKNAMAAIKIELLEILGNMEVMPFVEHPKVLDRKLQKTIKVIETAEPAEDNKVVECLKQGFFWKGNIFRPDEVIIKRYASTKNE